MQNLTTALSTPLSWLFRTPQASALVGLPFRQLMDLPTEEHILAVISVLTHTLPIEVVYIILDYACYWKIADFKYDDASPRPPLSIVALLPDHGYGTGRCVLLTEKLSRDFVSQLRAVAFSFESADQGWGGQIGASGTVFGCVSPHSGASRSF